MTMAHANSMTTAAEGQSLGVAGLIDGLRRAWSQHRTYRRTLAEMRALPADVLLDLDLDRSSLKQTVRAAAAAH